MKRNYDKYLEIIDESINVNWNFNNVYKKIVDGIIAEYEKEKMQTRDETTFNENPQ